MSRRAVFLDRDGVLNRGLLRDGRLVPPHGVDELEVLPGVKEALRLLASRLHEQGKLNLEEAFVDATFASAKKGASLLAPPGAVRVRRSSLSPLITVFLSPYLSKALRQPSAGLWRRFFPEASSTSFRPGSSATRPTTRTRSIKSSKASTASN